MNAPPDRRSRTVAHRLHEGWIEVSAYARSIPEALAIEAAIKGLPAPEAWVPDEFPTPAQIREALDEQFGAPELPPATAALADAAESKDADRELGLKAGEAG